MELAAVALMGVGVWLMYSAYRGEGPITSFKTHVTG